MPKPVAPGVDLGINTLSTERPEYTPVAVWRSADGRIVSRWKFSFLERLHIVLFGDLWLSSLDELPPTKLSTECPLID